MMGKPNRERTRAEREQAALLRVVRRLCGPWPGAETAVAVEERLARWTDRFGGTPAAEAAATAMLPIDRALAAASEAGLVELRLAAPVSQTVESALCEGVAAAVVAAARRGEPPARARWRPQEAADEPSELWRALGRRQAAWHLVGLTGNEPDEAAIGHAHDRLVARFAALIADDLALKPLTSPNRLATAQAAMLAATSVELLLDQLVAVGLLGAEAADRLGVEADRMAGRITAEVEAGARALCGRAPRAGLEA
jgi:hypothetical protein